MSQGRRGNASFGSEVGAGNICWGVEWTAAGSGRYEFGVPGGWDEEGVAMCVVIYRWCFGRGRGCGDGSGLCVYDKIFRFLLGKLSYVVIDTGSN